MSKVNVTNKEVEAISFACEQIRNEIEGCWEEDFVEYAGKFTLLILRLISKLDFPDSLFARHNDWRG